MEERDDMSKSTSILGNWNIHIISSLLCDRKQNKKQIGEMQDVPNVILGAESVCPLTQR